MFRLNIIEKSSIVIAMGSIDIEIMFKISTYHIGFLDIIIGINDTGSGYFIF